LTMSAVNQYNQSARPSVYYTSADRLDMAKNVHISVWYLRWCASVVNLSAATALLDEQAIIYGAYNLGVGAIRILLSGDFSSPILRKVFNVQAAALTAGGPSAYLSNVAKKIG